MENTYFIAENIGDFLIKNEVSFLIKKHIIFINAQNVSKRSVFHVERA